MYRIYKNVLRNWLLLSPLFFIISSCKEQLDLGVKETPRLTGLLKQIKVKSLDQALTYTLDYDLEKKKWKGYTVSDSVAKTSRAYVISQDTSGKILEMKNAAGTELVKYTYNIQGRLTEINSTFADKTSTKEKVSYENGRMDYYSKQLFQPDGSFTFPEARIYNIEGANLIGVVTSRPGKSYEEEIFTYDKNLPNIMADFLKKEWPFIMLEGFMVTPGQVTRSQKMFEGSIYQYEYKMNADKKLLEYTVRKTVDLVKWEPYLSYKMEYYQ